VFKKLGKIAIACSVILAMEISISSAVYAGCPVDPEDRLAAVQKAPTCEAANKLNDACSEATGADTEPSQAVIDKCERDFINKISGRQSASYKREKWRCQQKYSGERGSMYASFTMYCLAHVAKKYSLKWKAHR
jgi:uncharacterized lipoprotein YajG